MAGPILNLIRQLRENRMDRMGGGMGFDRPRLLPPMGMAMRNAPAVRPEPVTRVGRLLRSIGGGTSRQDYMARRREGMKPLERKTADDAADPDTTYSRPDNSTAVSPEDAKKIFAAASPSPAVTRNAIAKGADIVTTDARPAPLQGGAQDLPAPPMSRADAIRSQMAEIESKRRARKYSGEGAALLAQQTEAVDQDRMYGQLADQLAAETATEQSSLSYQQNEANRVYENAVETGDYATAETIFNASAAVQKDNTGRPVAEMMPDHAKLARPFVDRKINRVFNDFQVIDRGLAAVPPEERAKIIQGVAYAYPVSKDLNPQLDDSSRYQLSIRERDRIAMELNFAHNLDNNPAKTQYFTDLATYIVAGRGGLFTEPKGWFSGFSPSAWGSGTPAATGN
jgi:hypothetical protein